MESNAVIMFFTYSLGDDKKFVVRDGVRVFHDIDCTVHSTKRVFLIPCYSYTLDNWNTRRSFVSVLFFCLLIAQRKKHYTASCYLRATEHEFSVRLLCLHISKPCVRKSNTTV